ncbi:MAG TPA: hypothetical protein VFI59_02710 [Actinomycetota bacterium]|nr:hypothetical protein [Actinomycetota bacterium]
MDHADPLAEFVERVRNVYLPTYIANLDRRYIGRVVPGLPLSFNPDEIKTSAVTAAGFLRAVEEGPVERRPTSFGLPKDWPKGRCALFDRPTSKGRLPFLNEGPLDVAAAGLLALDLGWPEERLGFRTRPEYFGISAYGPQDDPMTKDQLVIAGETKWKQSEVDELVEDIPECSGLGAHDKEKCSVTLRRRSGNHHNKYRGLVKMHPQFLWLIGPDERHVFRLEYRGSKRVVLVPEPEDALRCDVAADMPGVTVPASAPPP